MVKIEIDYENFSIDELKAEYVKLINSKKKYELDLIYTTECLNNYKTPYSDRIELKISQVCAESMLNKIEKEISKIKNIASKRKIELESKVLQMTSKSKIGKTLSNW